MADEEFKKAEYDNTYAWKRVRKSLTGKVASEEPEIWQMTRKDYENIKHRQPKAEIPKTISVKPEKPKDILKGEILDLLNEVRELEGKPKIRKPDKRQKSVEKRLTASR